jgi:thymidylate synthase
MVFLNALQAVVTNGTRRYTRNGVTQAIFAYLMRFQMSDGFPAVTSKFIPFEVVKGEDLWFFDAGKETGGRLSLAKLNEFIGKPSNARNIWSKDQARFASQGKAKFTGDCGVIYGSQWRFWHDSNGGTVDQVAKVIDQLRNDPFSRYHIITAWNPGAIGDMCLPPCHMKMQFFVRPSKRRDKKMYLDLSMDQRSCDMFLGVPFNIASYAIILHMVAQCVDMVPGELIMLLEDCHIYLAGYKEDKFGGKVEWHRGHMSQVQEQLSRTPYRAPRLELNPNVKEIDDFTMDDIHLIGYKSHEKISAEML